MTMSRRLAAATLVASAFCALPEAARAAPPVFQRNGYAIGGFDVVSYFVSGKPTMGKVEFNHTWRDAVWLFSSAENRAKFVANPEAYAPQYGGYCTSGMSGGSRYNTDPTVWNIIDGKLYFTGSTESRDRWLRNSGTTISKANHWWQKANAGQ